MSASFSEESLVSEIRRRGITGLSSIQFDGRWHSFRWFSDEGTPKGSYLAKRKYRGWEIVFRHWKDESLQFCLKSSSAVPVSALEVKRFEEAERKENQLRLLRAETAALESERRWSLAREDVNHPYLKKKGLSSSYGTRAHNGILYVPLRDISEKLWGIESISSDGSLKFSQKYMRKKGNFHLIGRIKETKPLWICEGFSTGATLYEHTLQPVACSFGASNLLEVSQVFRTRYPHLEIIISGDADREGKSWSETAAKKTNSFFLIPQFSVPAPDYTDWNDLLHLEGRPAVIDQLSNYKKRKHYSPADKEEWVRQFLEDHDVRYLYGGLISKNDQFISYEALHSEIFMTAEREGLKIKDNFISHFLNLWIEAEKKKIWNETVQKIIPYDSSCLGVAEEFLNILLGPIAVDQLSVFLHFIWQVKRKALRKEVHYHMMPVFIGETGSGKSEAIKKLLSPLHPLSAGQSLNICSDERYFHFFSEYLVVNMDEMQRAEKTDLAGLKRTISADMLHYRVMRTHRNMSVQNNSTLIGSSNEELEDLIKDQTSIRRFYSFKTLGREELSRNWDRLNSLDFLKIWHSVDASADSPLLSHLGEIRMSQETMRHKDDIELWMEDRGITQDPQGRITSTRLYADYRKFCEENGYVYIKTQRAMSNRFRALGFESWHSMMDRGWKTVLILKG